MEERDITYITIRAEIPVGTVAFPNICILATLNEEGVLAGHCMQFNFSMESNKPEIVDAINDLIRKLRIQISREILVYHRQGKDFEEMYKGFDPKDEKWLLFLKIETSDAGNYITEGCEAITGNYLKVAYLRQEVTSLELEGKRQ